MTNDNERARKIAEAIAEHLGYDAGAQDANGRTEIDIIAEALTVERGLVLEAAAQIIQEAQDEWKDSAQARKSKTYAAYVIAAIDLLGRVRALDPAAITAARERLIEQERERILNAISFVVYEFAENGEHDAVLMSALEKAVRSAVSGGSDGR